MDRKQIVVFSPGKIRAESQIKVFNRATMELKFVSVT